MKRSFKATTPQRTRRPSDAEYRKVVRGHALDLQRLTALLGEGRINPQMWADAFQSVLVAGHTDAYALGRQRAGDLSPKSLADGYQGLDRADRYSGNLQNFLEAIERQDFRYFDAEGVLRQDQVNIRARMYCSTMRATASEGFVDAGEPDDEYDWELGPTEHCDDCVQLQRLGPYTQNTIISHPGDYQTDCKMNCHCRLKRRRGGIYTFDRVDLFGDALPLTSPAPEGLDPVQMASGSLPLGIPLPPLA